MNDAAMKLPDRYPTGTWLSCPVCGGPVTRMLLRTEKYDRAFSYVCEKDGTVVPKVGEE
jgi:hypothetical protein